MIMANYKDRIASIEEEMRQLENRKKEYLKKEKEAEHKARNHRVCKRGGYIESVVPALKDFSDEQFESFIKRTLLTDYATREMNKIKPPIAEPEAAETAESTGQNSGDVTNAPPTAARQAADATAAKPGESAKTSETTANANGKESRNGAA
jgi:hypothetical protein